MKLTSPVNSWRISSPFGPRWGRMHNGVDISVPSGTITRAPRSGKVLTAGFFDNSCGGTIVLEHSNPFGAGKITTAYCHMRAINVEKGESVIKGEVIGETGGIPNEKGAGNSLGPHLHFGIKVNGTWEDPDKYFEQGVLKSGAATRTIVLLVYVGALSYVIYSLLKKR
jgi:murein DD-endopeptidase MepM/ murein hydrolase activator NlpD